MPSKSIKLGLMPPLTGIVELYGPEVSWAGKIACEEINNNGGVLGQKLELIILDDGSFPEPSVNAANRLIDEFDCSAIIGNLLSNSRIAVSSLVSEPRKIPYLNFSFYEGSIQGRYFFNFAALPNQQINRMIPYMARHFGEKMYFAGNNYEWPRGSIDAAKKALQVYGGEILGEEYLPIGASIEEIQRLLESVANSGADVFVPYFAGADQINLLNMFAEMGLKKRMAVVMGHYDEAMVSQLSPDVREGLYSSNTYFMSLNTPQNKNYLELLEKQPNITGIHPHGNGVLTNFGEGTYICVHAYAKAVNMAGTTDVEAVVEALENVTIEAPQGIVSMDKGTHHAKVNTYLSRCESDGEFTIIESFGQISPIIPDRYRSVETLSPPTTPKTPSKSLQKELGFVSKSILEAADIAVIATDETGMILQVNKGAYQLFGYLKDELHGLSVNSLVPPHFRPFHDQAIKSFVLSDQKEIRMGKRGEITGYKKDGSFFPAEASISKFKSDDNEWVLVVTLMDISARKQAEDELIWRATHDPLTSLPNRALIKERLTNALVRTRRSEQNLGLLFVDLDKFKLVNDTYGHEAGDQLLIKVAKTLSEHVRPGDTVARLGGDEFVILCENIASEDALTQLADRINNALRTPLVFEDKEIVSTASIGLARGHGATHSADDLLRESDTAMYASKQHGRDRWQIFSSDLQVHSKQKLEIETGLRSALDKNEMVLFYQPIVSSANGHIKGMEALLRWNPPSGSVSPGIFIPIAEEIGMIVSIGRWVFEQACQLQAKLTKLYGDKAPYISVNVSAKQLDNEKVVDDFQDILTTTGADPHKILIEVTETSIMTDADENIRVLNALNKIGMNVAVDDFGTGYSSLLQLLRMPITHIKIDQEFVNGLDKREDSKLITSAVINMAKALGKRTIAEGVENQTQLFELKTLGVNGIQGYFFYRPMDEATLLEVLKNDDTIDEDLKKPEIYITIYISKAVEGLKKADIDRLISKAREFNLANAISGCLIYEKGYFLQLLEGEKKSIDLLMQKLHEDKNHTDVTTIMKGYFDHRLFSEWNMGYWDIDSAIQNPNIEVLMKKEISLKELSQDPRFCYGIFEGLANKATFSKKLRSF
ncbi:diguanylate cyclase [Hydrogenovibrio sp. SC-1]|uniref:ABC transporter substrate-binding protein n=1 Tax=Hydrogenovibrio sp. SC-1 TaxID=2065820 RepID=UPI000C7E11C6|nr:ABC transporter substrate-binding protein [Hydrogenovibrio sp. SC-1]PLA73492.1 diguanylate cyclase [Hydrogenovibrio sp. SC-1]